MWVLITKLRTSNSLEMQQYHKAAKALLVLTPLLGITYVVTIYSPGITDERVDVFECARAVLLSTQVQVSLEGSNRKISTCSCIVLHRLILVSKILYAKNSSQIFGYLYILYRFIFWLRIKDQ
nr:unnamed protein product [Callosobruchus chinensis]